MRSFFEMLFGLFYMLYYLIFHREESRQFDYDIGNGEIDDEK